jgi:hypothetical protein
MLMNHQDLFASALAAQKSHDDMWDMAAHLLDAGVSHDALYKELLALADRLRDEDREADEDRILDVMDCLVGWCGPQASLVSRGL